MSKSKIRETQNEIENLQAIDQDVRFRYRELMESLRSDLLTNEKECKKLQEQIEWVSRRRAELREEVIQYKPNLLNLEIEKMAKQPVKNKKHHGLEKELKKFPPLKGFSSKVSDDTPLTIIMLQKDEEDTLDNIRSANYNDESTKNN